jgi:hypothetical protein
LEVYRRIEEIAEADAIGDPSLLRDRLAFDDGIALETYRDGRAAMALIREAVEDCAARLGNARRLLGAGVHNAGRGSCAPSM